LLAALALALLVLVVLIAWRNSPPARQWRNLFVSDFANMLNRQQRSFIRETSGRALEETGVDIAVLTVRNMRGTDIITIEEFAWQNAVGWGLGGPDNSMFALLVYNREDGRAFIAAGSMFAYGALAPEHAHMFIEENMRPLYIGGRRGRGNALFEGYRAMVLQVYAQMGVVPDGDMLESLIPGAPIWDVFDVLWYSALILTAALIFYRLFIYKKLRNRSNMKRHGSVMGRDRRRGNGRVEIDVVRWDSGLDDGDDGSVRRV